MKYILIYFAIVSISAVIITIYDKSAAQKGKRRISERSLFLVSILGGSVAMLTTMRIIHHKTKHAKFMIGIPIIIVLQTALIIVGTLFYNGILQFNNPSREKYPIHGVDVSSYQGEIDWNILAENDIEFAFIKATEGSNFVDERFQYNWENAIKTDLKIGAYHFFSYDSSGEMQAENFINTVPKIDGMLPTVADVEFYGGNDKNPPPAEQVHKALTVFLLKLEEYYGKKPVIYVTAKSYDLYIKDYYDDYPIWIRDVVTFPKSPSNWTFWQYSNRKTLKGYNGKERFIDMNVFYGTEAEWAEWAEFNTQ